MRKHIITFLGLILLVGCGVAYAQTSNFRLLVADFIEGVNAPRSAIPGGEFEVSADERHWSTYDDGAVDDPVDGTGGSPADILDLSVETGFTIEGSGSGKMITSGPTDCDGEGWSIDFDLPDSDVGETGGTPAAGPQKQYIEFAYKTDSFDFADPSDPTSKGDLGFYVDNKDSSKLELIEFGQELDGSGYHTLAFQPTKGDDDYRFIVHCRVGGGPMELWIDKLKIGKKPPARAPPVTDWTDFTPTGSWTTNTTYAGSYRQVGDTLEVDITVSLSGAPNSATFLVDLPSGLVIDEDKLADSTQFPNIGHAFLLDIGTSSNRTMGQVYHNSTTELGITAIAAGDVTETSPFTWAVNDKIRMRARVPIEGWGSSQQVGFDDGRAVTLIVRNNGFNHTSSGSFVDVDTWSAPEVDSHAAFDESTGVFTCPVNAVFHVSGALTWNANATGLRGMRIKKESGDEMELTIPVAASDKTSMPFGQDIICERGEEIKLQAFQSSGGNLALATANNNSTLTITTKGSTMLREGERVVAKYTTNAGQLIGDSSVVLIDYEDLVRDSHNAMSGGVFTVPIAGDYAVQCSLEIDPATNWALGEAVQIRVHVEGSLTERGIVKVDAGGHTNEKNVSVYTEVAVNQGDTIDCRAFHDMGQSEALSTAGSFNFITIHRIK